MKHGEKERKINRIGKTAHEKRPRVWVQNILVYDIYTQLHASRDWQQVMTTSGNGQSSYKTFYKSIKINDIIELCKLYRVNAEETFRIIDMVRKLDMYYLKEVNK